MQSQNQEIPNLSYFAARNRGGRLDMGRKPKTTGPTARDAGAFKSIITRVNADGWRALRLLAVEKDTTLNALAVAAFNDLLRKNGKRASVINPLLPSEE
jgi:hypothetical protein